VAGTAGSSLSQRQRRIATTTRIPQRNKAGKEMQRSDAHTPRTRHWASHAHPTWLPLQALLVPLSPRLPLLLTQSQLCPWRRRSWQLHSHLHQNNRRWSTPTILRRAQEEMCCRRAKVRT
jgi:hypothetical protein